MKTAITIELTAPTLPEGETAYLAGSVNDWKVPDETYAFKRAADGKLALTLELTPGTVVEYKLHRGTWNTVECDAKGQEGENRRLAVFGATTVQIEVLDWRDQHQKQGPARVRETDVRVIGPLRIPVLGRDREIAVYLPPNYENEPERRYPVVYMWDGQNLFDPQTAFFNQEWRMDETCDRLINEGKIQPMIVVGVYNGGEHRLSEQSPWRDARLGARGEGHAFLRWVVGELKDYIDAEFRTLTGPEHTGVGGSSMGGLTALYAAYRYPLVFGRVMAMSPAFWFARGQIFRYIAVQMRPQGAKVYLDCGEKETARVHPKRDFYRMAYSMVELLKQQGFKEGQDLLWVSDPRGVHAEWCWANRLGPALEFLFPGDGVPRDGSDEREINDEDNQALISESLV